MNKDIDIQFCSAPVTTINGTIQAPGDKSISHRALIISAIAEGRSEISNLLMGADNLATLNILRQLGVGIEIEAQKVIVDGVGLHGLKASDAPLDCGNSGTGMRLLTGLLAGQNFDSTLVGDESLSQRPMARIVDPLTDMGAQITMSASHTPPLHITGGQLLQGVEYAMPVASAQIRGCLLLAGLYAKGNTTVIEPAPARDHTERMLSSYQYPLTIADKKVTLTSGHRLIAQDFEVPSDISSAAFFIVAASIIPGAQLTLSAVGVNPTRMGIINILKQMGADIQLCNQRNVGSEPVADIKICHAPLQGIQIPLDQVPLAIDEFPAIFIAAACAQGQTELRGAKELRVKETDRIAAMAEGLSQLGINNQPLEDGIIIEGGSLCGGEVNSYGDHRIAMAFAVAGCVATSEILIHHCANVATSFPNFVELANKVGMKITNGK